MDAPDGDQVRATAHVSATGPGADAELIWRLTADDGRERAAPRAPEAAATADIVGRLGHELAQPLAAITSYARGALLRSQAGTLSRGDLEQILSIIVAQAFRAADRLRELEAGTEGVSDASRTHRR